MKPFKIVAYSEGVSFLVLLGIAMPLKYIWMLPQAVRVVGMIHGVLFLAYVAMIAYLSSERGWSWSRSAQGFIASVIPFGPFIFQRHLSDEN